MLTDKNRGAIVIWIEGGNVQYVRESAGQKQDPQVVVVDVDNLKAEGRTAHEIKAIWEEIVSAGMVDTKLLNVEEVFAACLGESEGLSA